MDQTFEDHEKLLRAVWPPDKRPDFWRNGRLSSAALKDKRGLSVDRTGDRTLQNAVEEIKAHQHGLIVSFSAGVCKTVPVYLRYLPSRQNRYHSEIHGSESQVELSDVQALLLARQAVLE